MRSVLWPILRSVPWPVFALVLLSAGWPSVDAFAGSSSFTVSGSNFDLRVAMHPMHRIPLQADPADTSPEGFAAFSIGRGNRWFEHLRDTQESVDWYGAVILPHGSLRDTLRWDGRVALVQADPPDTVVAQVIASEGCGDLWAGCRPLRLDRGFVGPFNRIAAPHPRNGPQVVVYLGVPRGRVDPRRLCAVHLLGGCS